MIKSWRGFILLCSSFLLLMSLESRAENKMPGEVEAESVEVVAEETEAVATVEPTARPDHPLIVEARAMLAEPANFTEEDWQSLSTRIEAAIPDFASSQQSLQNQLREARATGRSDESIRPLLEQRAALDQSINDAIELLPEVAGLKGDIDHAHRELMEAMRLRVQAQQFVGTGDQDGVSEKAKSLNR